MIVIISEYTTVSALIKTLKSVESVFHNQSLLVFYLVVVKLQIILIDPAHSFYIF